MNVVDVQPSLVTVKLYVPAGKLSIVAPLSEDTTPARAPGSLLLLTIEPAYH